MKAPLSESVERCFKLTRLCWLWLWNLYLSISAHRTLTQHTLKGTAEVHGAIMYLKKRGMVSGQVVLLYSSYSSLTRAVAVSRRWRDNGGDLSDLGAPIVARQIINVHLWEKPRPLPRMLLHRSVIFSLLDFPSPPGRTFISTQLSPVCMRHLPSLSNTQAHTQITRGN